MDSKQDPKCYISIKILKEMIETLPTNCDDFGVIVGCESEEKEFKEIEIDYQHKRVLLLG